MPVRELGRAMPFLFRLKDHAVYHMSDDRIRKNTKVLTTSSQGQGDHITVGDMGDLVPQHRFHFLLLLINGIA
jgi:hypothetical protein